MCPSRSGILVTIFSGFYLIFASPMPLASQVVDQAVSTSHATVSADRGIVKAGEEFKITLHLISALPSGTQLAIGFTTQADNFDARAVADGSTDATFIAKPPKDATGGDYTARTVQFTTGRRWVDIPIDDPLTIKVIASPNATPFPSRATAKLSLDQQQYIRNQVPPLVKIRQDLISRLAVNSVDSAELRIELIKAVVRADELLPQVKAEYLELYKEKPASENVLFDDFDARYRQLLVDLKSPSWPGPSASPVALRSANATLFPVQLEKRNYPPKQSDSIPIDQRSTAYPPSAAAVLELLLFNIRAYNVLADSKVDTFSLRLATHPAGATVSYSRVGQPYIPFSRKTVIDQATFPYAIWTFKFELAGCDPYFEEANPYIEARPNLDVELTCKNK